MRGDDAEAASRGSRSSARTCALLCLLDVFLSPVLEAQGAPDETLHSRCQTRAGQSQTGIACFLDRAPWGELVEPDGIEPTTSCLQSTRSTD
jgi:hypothetical protein